MMCDMRDEPRGIILVGFPDVQVPSRSEWSSAAR
jgi:hypothetical protein